MLGLAMTVTIQSVGLLDLTSITERTNPVTSDPFIFTVVFFAAVLVVVAASRDFWICRLERLHALQVAARETVPRPCVPMQR
jgi:ABC-type arginine transport system permease subunit